MKTKKILLVLLLVMLITPGTQVCAASKKGKALKAYSAFLARNESTFLSTVPRYGYFSKTNTENTQKADSFLIVDLDKNGIPELVTRHIVAYKNSLINVYTYKNGKIKKVKNYAAPRRDSAPYIIPAPTYTAPTSSWGLLVWKCKKKHLHVSMMSGAGSDEYIYYMKKGKLKLYAQNCDHYRVNGTYYKYKGKRVSAKKFSSVTKGCVNKGWLVDNSAGTRASKLK